MGLQLVSEIGFLKFSDYFSANTHLDLNWITVGRLDEPSSNDSFGIFSVMVPNNRLILKTILNNFEWEQYTNFGNPYFFRNRSNPDVHFATNQSEEKDGVLFEAFTILREFHTAFPARIDIIQNFVLYHGLYYDPKQEKYIEPITEDFVINYRNPCFVDIKSDYLKDYLAARKMVLVRYHDVRRLIKKPLSVLTGKNVGFNFVQVDRNFSVTISQDILDNQATFSRMLGKDVVHPFDEPHHKDYLFLAGKVQKEFVKFVIGVVDANHNKIEETCDERQLSDNFVNTGKPHALTPVFFKKRVLQKYYQNPQRYTIKAGRVNCLDLWGIPFGLNDEDLVHVWLGDLGHLPFEEQLHFRQYNVPPSGNLDQGFYQTQMLAKFVQTTDPSDLLINLYEEINKLSHAKFDFKLFEELSKGDEHIYKTIRVPTTNEQGELDEQLIALSKLFTDSINKSEIKKKLRWLPPTKDEDTKIRYLEKLLEEIFGLNSTDASQIAKPFRVLQQMRSKSAAHRKTEEFEKELKKFNLDGKTNFEICDAIIHSLLTALKAIKVQLEK